MIDIALNHYAGAATLHDITRSSEFYEHCQQAHGRFRAAEIEWKAPLAETALSDPRCKLLHMYLDRETARILKSQPHSDRLRDATADAVRRVFFEIAREYRVGTVDENGPLTWGYEAFLARRLPGKARAVIQKLIGECGRLDEEKIILAAPENSDVRRNEVSAVLREILPAVLRVTWTRRAYSYMIYEGASARDAARTLQRKPSDIHRFIFAPLARELRRVLGTTTRRACYFGPALRQSLEAIFGRSEFEQLFNGGPLA